MSRTACLTLLTLLSAQATGAPPPQGPWHCTFSQDLRCDPGRDCAEGDFGTTVILDEAAGLYRSCSPGHCIPSPARFQMVGEDLTVHVTSSATVVRLSPEREVTEVGMIGPIVFIRRGRCTAAPPSPARR